MEPEKRIIINNVVEFQTTNYFFSLTSLVCFSPLSFFLSTFLSNSCLFLSVTCYTVPCHLSSKQTNKNLHTDAQGSGKRWIRVEQQQVVNWNQYGPPLPSSLSPSHSHSPVSFLSPHWMHNLSLSLLVSFNSELFTSFTSLSHSHSLSLKHTHTRCPHSLNLHTHTYTQFHSLSFSVTHTHTCLNFSFLSLTRERIHPCMQGALSTPHTLTHTCTHSHTHSDTTNRALYFSFFLRGCANFFPETLMQRWFIRFSHRQSFDEWATVARFCVHESNKWLFDYRKWERH